MVTRMIEEAKGMVWCNLIAGRVQLVLGTIGIFKQFTLTTDMLLDNSKRLLDRIVVWRIGRKVFDAAA